MVKKISKLLEISFPLVCTFCTSGDLLSSKIGICRKCYQSRPHSSLIGSCPVCASANPNGLCLYCSSRNVFFDKLYFIRERNIQEKEIIQKIKFKNEPYLSGYFRIGIRGIFSDIIKNYSSFRITVAPSHKKTVSGRPYHSCSSILDYARRSVTTTVEQPIEKISGELQSGKTFRERFLHARHAFRIKSEFVNRLSGNWLLVDDVFTTGASINEISRLLKENGAENVIALVMAKNL